MHDSKHKTCQRAWHSSILIKSRGGEGLKAKLASFIDIVLYAAEGILRGIPGVCNFFNGFACYPAVALAVQCVF